jgi:ABC transport system ATP-binding/permease protein
VRERSEAVPAPVVVQTKRKLSFKEKYALDNLPAKIDALKIELTNLESVLADSTLFTRDPKTFEKSSKRHAAACGELMRAEEQWLELEMMREELETR